MKINIIYNSEINLKNWVSSRNEIMPKAVCGSCRTMDCVSCSDFYKMCESENSNNFGDEEANLDIKLNTEILALIDVGRWNGRINGYTFLGFNLNNIFKLSEEHNKYYCDAYNVCATLKHHDSSNFVIYRKLKPNVSKEKVEHLLFINNGILTKSQMSQYTESLRPEVAKIYGW